MLEIGELEIGVNCGTGKYCNGDWCKFGDWKITNVELENVNVGL